VGRRQRAQFRYHVTVPAEDQLRLDPVLGRQPAQFGQPSRLVVLVQLWYVGQHFAAP
jgi:hypothetical protein